jgi:hypothetical protein
LLFSSSAHFASLRICLRLPLSGGWPWPPSHPLHFSSSAHYASLLTWFLSDYLWLVRC